MVLKARASNKRIKQNTKYKRGAVAKLGGGSFGDILAAANEADPHDWTALKIEARYSM